MTPTFSPSTKGLQEKQMKLQMQVQKLGIFWGCKPNECSP